MSTSLRVIAGVALAGGLVLAGSGFGCGNTAPPADPATIRAGGRVFSQAGCGTCHSLAAAGSSGRIGPSLDRRRPLADTVARQVGRGGRGMPAYTGRLSDDEIRAVSTYVAEVAGR